MKRINQSGNRMKRQLFRTVFGIFSLSGIMFAFQACYGTPQDIGLDVLIEGKVTSAVSKASVAGIKVMLGQSGQYTSSAADGTFSMFCERLEEYNLIFSDPDGQLNGLYQACDTIVRLDENEDNLTVNIELK